MTTIRYGNFQVQLLVPHGTRVDRVQLDTPAPQPRLRGVGQAAAPAGVPLVGRADLLDRLATLPRPGWAVELRAACGFGKSSLLAALAVRLADHTAAPAVYLRVGAELPDDILDQLVGTLFTSNQPYRPTPQERAGLLGTVRAVVVLDDVTLEPRQLAQVTTALPQCLLLLGSDQPVLDSDTGGVSVALPGLAEPAGVQLLVRDLGRPLHPSEAGDAARLCTAVDGQPLRLRQAAALAATGQHTLQRLADRAERDPAALDRLSVHALAETERRVLAVLALVAGAVLPGDLVQAISGVDDLAAQLDKLRRRGLVERHHDRFGLPRCLGAGYRQLLVANLEVGAATRSLTGWLAQRDPSSADALAAAGAAVQLVGRLAERGDWPELARLAEVTARVLTLAGRWDLCRQILQQGLHAAQQLGDLAAQARFAHDLGAMALCNDQLQQAEALLNHALALRQQLGDHQGAALTRHNRDLMTPPDPPPPPDQRDQRRKRRQRRRKRLSTLTSLLGLAVFLLVLGWRVISPAVPVTTSTTTTSAIPAITVTTAAKPGSPAATATSIATSPSPAATTTTPTNPAVTTHRTSPLTTSPSGPSTPGIAAPTTQVPLTGGGPSKAQPALQPPILAPDQWDFGAVNSSPGRLPAGHTFTVVNPNPQPLAITSASVTGDPAFTISADRCSTSTLAPKGSCTVTVAFRPTTVGARTGGLTISSAQGSSSTAKLTGSGFVRLTLTVGEFGTVQDAWGHKCTNTGPLPVTCTMRISASDQAAMTLTTTTIAGYQFTFWGDACSGQGESCHLYLTRDTTVSAWFTAVAH